MKIYIGGALTRLNNDNRKKFYEAIAERAKALGFVCHVPHLMTDPKKHPMISPAEVYTYNYEKVKEADILLAYVGEASTGTGIEVEIAKNNNTKVVLIYEKDCPVTRMARGNPAVVEEIAFANENDALDQIETFLKKTQI